MAFSSASGLRLRPANPAGAFTYAAVGNIRPNAPVPAATPALPPGLHRCAPGPWGEIEYHFIYLEASEQLVSHYSLPSTQPRWTFPNATPEQLAALFEAAQIPPD